SGVAVTKITPPGDTRHESQPRSLVEFRDTVRRSRRLHERPRRRQSTSCALLGSDTGADGARLSRGQSLGRRPAGRAEDRLRRVSGFGTQVRRGTRPPRPRNQRRCNHPDPADFLRSLVVLGDDAELDRLRNLMIVRHVENPERQPVRESYHLVTMSRTLERAGDHAKNLAEETCHLVTGRSVRHVLREYDRSFEQGFVDKLRRTIAPKT